jgi:glycosyltransferase involved in cell wall biosynthesis
MKLAVVATHPIQYQIPLYQQLSKQEKMDLTVYYTLIPDRKQQGTGFGIPFTWDIPMFDGYKWEVLRNTLKTPSLIGFFNSSTPCIYDIFKKNKPDVVLITGWHSLPLLQALWACMRLRIPRLIRGDSHALPERSGWKKMLHRILLSLYSGFLAVGKANKAFYLKNGIKPALIFQCPHFVDNNRFREQCITLSKERKALRSLWSIPEGYICFLFAGKIEPKKRLIDLLQAIEFASKKRQDIHLLVVGTGELMEQAERYAAERLLPVTFAGFLNQTEIARAYVAADCLVLPSDYGETWGLVVNEGMVCGLPPIVSDRVGCGPDLVKDGITGYVFPFGNIEVLASKLIIIASDAANRITLGINAQKLIQNYTVEKAVEGTLQAIDFILKK